MKIRNNVLIVLLLILLPLLWSACQGLGDAARDLGDGYVYRSDGGKRWIRSNNIYKEGIPVNVIAYNYKKKLIDLFLIRCRKKILQC
jgi:hypothetical protein